jgi:hypothetical protein
VFTRTAHKKEVHDQPSKLSDTVAGVSKARHESGVSHPQRCTRSIRVRGEDRLSRQPIRTVPRRLGDNRP